MRSFINLIWFLGFMVSVSLVGCGGDELTNVKVVAALEKNGFKTGSVTVNGISAAPNFEGNIEAEINITNYKYKDKFGQPGNYSGPAMVTFQHFTDGIGN